MQCDNWTTRRVKKIVLRCAGISLTANSFLPSEVRPPVRLQCRLRSMALIYILKKWNYDELSIGQPYLEGEGLRRLSFP